jgi:hypothetical protein
VYLSRSNFKLKPRRTPSLVDNTALSRNARLKSLADRATLSLTLFSNTYSS